MANGYMSGSDKQKERRNASVSRRGSRQNVKVGTDATRVCRKLSGS